MRRHAVGYFSVACDIGKFDVSVLRFTFWFEILFFFVSQIPQRAPSARIAFDGADDLLIFRLKIVGVNASGPLGVGVVFDKGQSVLGLIVSEAEFGEEEGFGLAIGGL